MLVERLVENLNWKGFTIDWQTTHAAILELGRPLIEQSEKLGLNPRTGASRYQRVRADPDQWWVAREEDTRVFEQRDGSLSQMNNFVFGGAPRVAFGTSVQHSRGMKIPAVETNGSQTPKPRVYLLGGR